MIVAVYKIIKLKMIEKLSIDAVTDSDYKIQINWLLYQYSWCQLFDSNIFTKWIVRWKPN